MYWHFGSATKQCNISLYFSVAHNAHNLLFLFLNVIRNLIVDFSLQTGIVQYMFTVCCILQSQSSVHAVMFMFYFAAIEQCSCCDEAGKPGFCVLDKSSSPQNFCSPCPRGHFSGQAKIYLYYGCKAFHQVYLKSVIPGYYT